MLMDRMFAGLAACLAVTFILSSCSPTDGESRLDEPNSVGRSEFGPFGAYSAEQADWLGDREVTEKELSSAWELYASCMEKAGYAVKKFGWSPVTHREMLFTYKARPEIRVAESADIACEEKYWTPTSLVFAAQREPYLSQSLIVEMRTCMGAKDYVVPEVVTWVGFAGSKSGNLKSPREIAAESCLSSSMSSAYPDIPYWPSP